VVAPVKGWRLNACLRRPSGPEAGLRPWRLPVERYCRTTGCFRGLLQARARERTTWRHVTGHATPGVRHNWFNGPDFGGLLVLNFRSTCGVAMTRRAFPRTRSNEIKFNGTSSNSHVPSVSNLIRTDEGLTLLDVSTDLRHGALYDRDQGVEGHLSTPYKNNLSQWKIYTALRQNGRTMRNTPLRVGPRSHRPPIPRWTPSPNSEWEFTGPVNLWMNTGV